MKTMAIEGNKVFRQRCNMLVSRENSKRFKESEDVWIKDGDFTKRIDFI